MRPSRIGLSGGAPRRPDRRKGLLDGDILLLFDLQVHRKAGKPCCLQAPSPKASRRLRLSTGFHGRSTKAVSCCDAITVHCFVEDSEGGSCTA